MPAPDQDAEPTAERLGDIVSRVTRTLTEAGIETPGVDARRLVAEACGRTSAELIARPEELVAASARQLLNAQVQRRCAGEPVSRILGTRDFYGRAFAVSPATLDPRPDSETVIETVLEWISEKDWREKPLRILDVGTGSGCLLVTLLAELPNATGLGTDISAEALGVAAENARHHDVAERVQFAQHDLLQGVAGPFDLLVCNPPYIPTGTIGSLAREVRDYDPRQALDGGADGLDAYRRLVPELKRVVPNGWAVFEVGAGQADSVAELLRQLVQGCGRGEQGDGIRYRNDFGGHTRCVAMEIQL
jgi:release factor glutamine methyltransferase